ncbi:MAG: glycosyltransferase [Actinobacteria bacterium]|nr:glycosyltransferase [Actinomycetota bacterium]
MNILLIASNNRFGDSDAGFTHPYGLAKAFSKLGHDVTAIFKPSGDRPASFIKNGVKIYTTDWSTRISNFPRFLINFFKELSYLSKRRNQIDLIYERYELSRFSTGLISRMLKIPCAIEINTPVLDVRFRKRKFIRKILEKIDQFHLSQFDFVITQTENLAAIIRQRYKKEIFIIPNGADAELFMRNDEKFQGEIINRFNLKGKKIIGYLGAMMPWHGISDLLDALKTLLANQAKIVSKASPMKSDDLALLIIGGSKEEIAQMDDKPIQELISQNRIVPVGGIDHELVPYYLNICDVLVAPFNTNLDIDRRDLYEKFGMWWCPIKLFEYLATGKPIVTTGLKEIRSYLSKHAYYYMEGNTVDLARAITDALNEGKNLELQAIRKSYFENNFTWEIQARKVLDITGLLTT